MSAVVFEDFFRKSREEEVEMRLGVGAGVVVLVQVDNLMRFLVDLEEVLGDYAAHCLGNYCALAIHPPW